MSSNRAAVERLDVGVEVQRPHMVGAHGPQPLRRDRRVPPDAGASSSLRHPQAVLAPQPLRTCALCSKPSSRNSWRARRYPHRGRLALISCNRARNTASSAAVVGS
jgi:hypothetical protein